MESANFFSSTNLSELNESNADSQYEQGGPLDPGDLPPQHDDKEHCGGEDFHLVRYLVSADVQVGGCNEQEVVLDDVYERGHGHLGETMHHSFVTARITPSAKRLDFTSEDLSN